MPREEFVMRGQTASGETEVLNFGMKSGYAFRLLEFELYPSTNIGQTGFSVEACGTITAGKTAVAPTDPDFSNEGLIAVASHNRSSSPQDGPFYSSIVNDTYLISQNLILMVQNTASGGEPVNWQCRFKPVKVSDTQQANVNYRQFSVFDE